MIHVSDFSNWALENYNTDILQSAKDECARKMKFHQDEINSGHIDAMHFEGMAKYKSEFIKWIPIVRAAIERDTKREQEFDSKFK